MAALSLSGQQVSEWGRSPIDSGCRYGTGGLLLLLCPVLLVLPEHDRHGVSVSQSVTGFRSQSFLPTLPRRMSSAPITDGSRPLPMSEYSHDLMAKKAVTTSCWPIVMSILFRVHDRTFWITSNGRDGLLRRRSWVIISIAISSAVEKGVSCPAALWIGL